MLMDRREHTEDVGIEPCEACGYLGVLCVCCPKCCGYGTIAIGSEEEAECPNCSGSGEA